MPANIAYIHANKLAKLNQKYVGPGGKVYIGLANGRLKLFVPISENTTTQNVTNIVDNSTTGITSVLTDGVTVLGDGVTTPLSSPSEAKNGYFPQGW